VKRIMFLFQLPPPIHGASMVNLSIKNSEYINSKIDSCFVDISPASDISGLGKLSVAKVFSTFPIVIKCISKYFRFKPSRVYITLSPHGFGFWKDALILQILKFLGANIVVHLHGKGINEEVSASRIKLLIYRSVFRSIDVIHLSKSLFSDLDLVLDHSMTISEVNNGVEDHSQDFIEDSCLPTFIYLSNLDRTKGADVLIDAVNLLGVKYEGRFLVNVVGKSSDSEFYSGLTGRVDERFKSTVRFLGPLYGDDKYKALGSSDVFVLPTRFRNECFPLSILEAMSFGLPVLSTFEGAIPDIVDDAINGYLFSSGDAQSLADKMANYINDSNLICSHGEAARDKYKKKYTIESFERALIKSLLDVDGIS